MSDSPAPNALELVRDHIVPVLVETGVIAPYERAHVRDAQDAQDIPPPGHGQVTVVPGRLRITPPDDAAPEYEGSGDIHVHIDRVQVLRSSPAPAPAGHAVPRVDLDAYLARRRGEYR